jgi:predicted DNA-binding transcriptional regulator AlpA
MEMWRVKKVAQVAGISVASVWRWSADGRLPAPYQLGASAVAWKSSEIMEWMENLPRANIQAEAA